MSDNLVKADLVNYLAEVTGFSKVDSQHFVDMFFENIADALSKGVQVKLSGFGNFLLRDKVARPGRNPKTKVSVAISARRVVTWSQTKKLMKRVDNYGRSE